MFNCKILAANIRQARLLRNYTQDYLAHKLGMSQNGYSKIELGQTAVSVEKLLIIAGVLEIDIKALIGGASIADDVEAVSQIAIGPQLLEIICQTTGMGFAAIARVTEDRWIACRVLDKIAFGLKAGGELQIETTICNEIRHNNQAVVIDDVSKDAIFANHLTPALYGFKSYISVPIYRHDGTFFGTLCAIDPKPAMINTPRIVGMFNLFAQLISVYLEGIERSAFDQNIPDEGKLRSIHLQFKVLLGNDVPAAILSILEVAV